MLSIVIPCLNEERAINDVADLFRRRLSTLRSHFNGVEVIVVDDGSTDGSVSVIEKQNEVYSTLVKTKSAGYGGAIKAGIRRARGHFIGIMDMDATYDPGDFAKLIKKSSNDEVMLLGNRIHQTSALNGLRWVGNSLFKSMFRIALNSEIRDPSCGIRIFNRQWLEGHLATLPDDLSFAFATSVMCAIQNKPFIQEDVRYYDRVGESKLQEFRDGFRFLSVAWKLSRDNRARENEKPL